MHVNIEDYEHRGVRYVDLTNISSGAGAALSGLVAASGTSGSSIEFSSELRHDKDEIIWDELTAGGGSTVYDTQKNAVEIIANNNKTVRESYNAINLHAGRRIVATLSAILKVQSIEGGVAYSRMGLFDVTADKTAGADGSGVYVEYEFKSNLFNIVLNSAWSGAEVPLSLSQGQWNIDNLNGAGPSELNLTLDATEINTFRFEIGSDRGQYITVYYMYNGTPIALHEFQLNQEGTYILTDNLPLRYEIETAEVFNHSFKQLGSNVVSYGGRGQFSKVGTALIETPNEVQTSGGNEEFFMSLKNTDDTRINTKLTKLFFDAQGNTPYQFFYKIYLRRNPAAYIGNSYASIYATGVLSSLGFDAIEYSNFIANNPFNVVIAAGIWDRAATFNPFDGENNFRIGNGINGLSDELIITVRRTDAVDTKDVWGGVEVMQIS